MPADRIRLGRPAGGRDAGSDGLPVTSGPRTAGNPHRREGPRAAAAPHAADRPLIYPVFLPFQGCPHRCIFCDARVVAGGTTVPPSARELERLVSTGRRYGPSTTACRELAFYGGSFTGMSPEERARVLSWTKPLLDDGRIDGLRVSTRPDLIDEAMAGELRQGGVKVVEVGAQSFADHVLDRAGRGHAASDTVRSVSILRKAGLAVVIHLMAGLPGDSEEGFRHSVNQTVALRPDMVRVHPTLVLRGTRLAEEWRRGSYVPLAMDSALRLGRNALRAFARAGIPVIRLGLQTSIPMETGSVLAGPFHPAFRSLAEEGLFAAAAGRLFVQTGIGGGVADIRCHPRDVSRLRGNRNGNIQRLQERFRLSALSVTPDEGLPAGILSVGEGGFPRTDVYRDGDGIDG